MQLPRRLYVRMMVYISLALVIFVTLGVVSVVTVASIELRNYSATRHSSLGHRAADVLTTGGRPALEKWLQDEANIPADVIAYVLDQNSEDILGRRIPPELVNFVRTSVVVPRDSDSANYRPVRLAPQLIGPGNESYAFLVLPRGVSIFGSLGTALGVLLAALLVIVSIAGLIARAVGRPIGELQLAARELAMGHINARVPASIVNRHDELGTLAADFNTMADRISALIESRQQLMSELSHELRSPLARLQTALALAGHRQSLTPAERERIEQEIQRMDLVIGDLLRFTRLDAAATIHKRLVRLDELLGDLVATEELEAAARRCRLELAATGDLAVVGDRDLLRSGIENILRNAIRYAGEDSVVQLEAHRDGDELVIRVLDRGPGVPDADLDRIFEPYVRVADGAGKAGGTGLGLAIARRVVEVHGGRVSASNREGGGLAVTVRLPAAG